MWWECSACGESFENHRRPVRCPECGTAGVIFTSLTDENLGDGEERLRAWLELGVTWPHERLGDQAARP